jgi:hypothetical protein
MGLLTVAGASASPVASPYTGHTTVKKMFNLSLFFAVINSRNIK